MSKKYTRQLTLEKCFICTQPIEAEITGRVEVGEGRVIQPSQRIKPAGISEPPQKATIDVRFVPTKLVIRHECEATND